MQCSQVSDTRCSRLHELVLAAVAEQHLELAMRGADRQKRTCDGLRLAAVHAAALARVGQRLVTRLTLQPPARLSAPAPCAKLQVHASISELFAPGKPLCPLSPGLALQRAAYTVLMLMQSQAVWPPWHYMSIRAKGQKSSHLTWVWGVGHQHCLDALPAAAESTGRSTSWARATRSP